MPVLMRPPMRAPTGCEAGGFLVVVALVLVLVTVLAFARGDWGIGVLSLAGVLSMVGIFGWLRRRS